MSPIKVKQQTFTGNGITIEFPAGYARIQDYISVLNTYIKHADNFDISVEELDDKKERRRLAMKAIAV